MCPCMHLTATGLQAMQCSPILTLSTPSISLSSISLGSCLLLFSFPVGLTHNDDLDQSWRKVKVGQQIASKQSDLSLCANSVRLSVSVAILLSPLFPSLSPSLVSPLPCLCLPEGGLDVFQGGLAAMQFNGSLVAQTHALCGWVWMNKCKGCPLLVDFGSTTADSELAQM